MNARFGLLSLGFIIAGGELRALEEKVYIWRGKSSCIGEIRSKPEPIGPGLSNFVFEWKLLVFLYVSGCVMYPFDNCTNPGEKQSICDVFMWDSKLHNPAFDDPCLVPIHTTWITHGDRNRWMQDCIRSRVIV